MALTIVCEMPRKRQGDTDFGKRLIRLRKARGLTQVELAEAAGTTQRAISYYENEAAYPPALAVIALAKALRISTDEILGLRPPKPTPLEKDPELRRLWRRFQKVQNLPERDQRAVIRLINSLATTAAAGSR
ncbi:MAG: helix-turn-helix transcriptional regulator [Thermoanaerobaculia bacterium]